MDMQLMMTARSDSWAKRHALALYFILAYAVSWSIEIPIALSVQGLIQARIPLWLHYFASFGPMTGALVLTGLTEGREGLRNLARRILKWRVEGRYYAFVLLGPAGLFALACLLNRVVTGEWPDLSLLGLPDYLPYITPIGTLGLWLFTYSLGEESGWRGFALPRLQKNRSAASATLVLALLWAGWHLPAFFYRDTYAGLGMLGFPMFAVSILFTAMVFTWLYNSTGGSVWMAILFHAVFNWLAVSEAGGQFAAPIMSIPIIVWALVIPRKYGMEDCAPVPKQAAG
jgi:membrane protease YdiL (CAAX protease family)